MIDKKKYEKWCDEAVERYRESVARHIENRTIWYGTKEEIAGLAPEMEKVTKTLAAHERGDTYIPFAEIGELKARLHWLRWEKGRLEGVEEKAQMYLGMDFSPHSLGADLVSKLTQMIDEDTQPIRDEWKEKLRGRFSEIDRELGLSRKQGL